MWLYSGPSYPDCPFSEKLSAAEVDAWIHKVLDLRGKLNPRAGLAPLPGELASTKVSTLGPISVAFMIISFHRTHDLA
jgi:hypothetical protein